MGRQMIDAQMDGWICWTGELINGWIFGGMDWRTDRQQLD